ncbi:MAG: tetratricopeptide repeat protein [Deltaproteobacteria bacterium]|nr:tetratricopeptide repeat protein [Deltaproteobacteria bacterium]
MSYINDALKKAQEERSSRYGAHGELLQSLPAKTGRRMPVIIAAAVILVLATVLVVWKNSGMVVSIIGSTAPPQGALQETVVRPAEETAKPAEQDDLYRRALNLQRRGQMGKAETLYRQILRTDPNNRFALNNLGVLCLHGGRIEEAERLFERALQGRGGYADPHYNLSCLYARTGKVEEALSSLVKAVDLDREMLTWADRDPDLEKIRSHPRYRAIGERYRAVSGTEGARRKDSREAVTRGGS